MNVKAVLTYVIYFIIYMSIEDNTDLSRERRFFKSREDSRFFKSRREDSFINRFIDKPSGRKTASYLSQRNKLNIDIEYNP